MMQWDRNLSKSDQDWDGTLDGGTALAGTNQGAGVLPLLLGALTSDEGTALAGMHSESLVPGVDNSWMHPSGGWDTVADTPIPVPLDPRLVKCILYLCALPVEARDQALQAMRDIYEDSVASQRKGSAPHEWRAPIRVRIGPRQSMPEMPIGD